MTNETVPSMRPQPMIAVADVANASRWYQQVLGATSGHGGAGYEQLLVDGQLIMQLHRLETGHHHGMIGDPGQPTGNGVALWFETSGFDAVVVRIRDAVRTGRGRRARQPQRRSPRDLAPRPRRLSRRPGRALRGRNRSAVRAPDGRRGVRSARGCSLAAHMSFRIFGHTVTLTSPRWALRSRVIRVRACPMPPPRTAESRRK